MKKRTNEYLIGKICAIWLTGNFFSFIQFSLFLVLPKDFLGFVFFSLNFGVLSLGLSYQYICEWSDDDS